MHTLALQDRDLAITPGKGFTLYTGTKRLQQDLTLALGEEYGNDRFHPNWGCVLVRFIGLPINDTLRHEVEAEVSRVVNNYLIAQQEFVRQDLIKQVQSRFTTADLMAEVVSIKTRLQQDTIDVVIEIRNLDRTSILVQAQAANA